MKKIFVKTVIPGFMGAVCALIAYALWITDVGNVEGDDDDHHHHHEEFLAFSDDLAQSHGIVADKAAPGSLKQKVRAPARIAIVSDQIAHVLPKVSGIVVKAYKNLGEMVTRNETLAVLESKEMAEAKAEYLTALKKMELTEGLYARESTLHGKKLNAAEALQTAENAKDASRIDLDLSREKLHALGLSYKKIEALPNEPARSMKSYELKSPITGQIIARNITPGEMVTSDNEVYVVADLSIVWAEINVSAQDRQYVKVGQPVTITDNHGNVMETVISFLSPIIDPDTRTSKAIATINNQYEQWLPGSFAQAEFITDVTDVPVSISKEAIQTVDGVNVVFVTQPDGFAVRPVVVGRSDDTCCEVLSGLNPGEKYASTNTFLLKADLKKEEAEHMD